MRRSRLRKAKDSRSGRDGTEMVAAMDHVWSFGNPGSQICDYEFGSLPFEVGGSILRLRRRIRESTGKYAGR